MGGKGIVALPGLGSGVSRLRVIVQVTLLRPLQFCR